MLMEAAKVMVITKDWGFFLPSSGISACNRCRHLSSPLL